MESLVLKKKNNPDKQSQGRPGGEGSHAQVPDNKNY